MHYTKLYQGDSALGLKGICSNSVDLVVTSPPYDNLRSYDGAAADWGFSKFKEIANESVRVLKPNGVLVWNVNDQCKNGSYSCNSMRQVLYFTEELGLRLHQTIAWVKKNPMPQVAKKRYQTAFELLYVFSKGEPKTFNPIMRECKNYGKEYTQKFRSQIGRCSERIVNRAVSKEVVDNNVWAIATANATETNYVLKDGRKIHHTAVFPMELARRVIQTWSNEGDAVLDPFMGSGTTGIAAVELGRSFIGCELNDDYFTMASERIENIERELSYTVAEESLCA
jgi:site-specific DNA-methyltransferase (adenine-specific)